MPVLVYVIRFNYYGGEIDYCVYLRVTGKRKNNRTTINIHDKTDSFATT